MALDSIICSGTIVSGGKVERSILSPRVRVNSYAQVTDSILFEGVEVGRHAMVRRAIIDKGVRIPAGMQIGYDLELDRRRGFTVSSNGVVVIAKTEALQAMEGEQMSLSDGRMDSGMSNKPPVMGRTPGTVKKSGSMRVDYGA